MLRSLVFFKDYSCYANSRVGTFNILQVSSPTLFITLGSIGLVQFTFNWPDYHDQIC